MDEPLHTSALGLIQHWGWGGGAGVVYKSCNPKQSLGETVGTGYLWGENNAYEAAEQVPA